MKKSLIAAGAASAVLAAMPVLGVFADQMTVKDQLTVTVSESCTLAGIQPAGVTEATPNNYYGTGAPGELVTLAAGTKVSPNSGTSTSVRVECNDDAGYTISAVFTDLELQGGNAVIEYGVGADEAAAGSGTWTAYASGTAINPTNGITGESTMTDTYTFTYKAGLSADQAAGDYVGTATYTLAAN